MSGRIAHRREVRAGVLALVSWVLSHDTQGRQVSVGSPRDQHPSPSGPERGGSDDKCGFYGRLLAARDAFLGRLPCGACNGKESKTSPCWQCSTHREHCPAVAVSSPVVIRLAGRRRSLVEKKVVGHPVWFLSPFVPRTKSGFHLGGWSEVGDPSRVGVKASACPGFGPLSRRSPACPR